MRPNNGLGIRASVVVSRCSWPAGFLRFPLAVGAVEAVNGNVLQAVESVDDTDINIAGRRPERR